ncbi:MAG: hypothetical protein HQL65_18330 [Magnetococcales bacterium]|nr:hypothetical protein [Magnetococcales bacterium]
MVKIEDIKDGEMRSFLETTPEDKLGIIDQKVVPFINRIEKLSSENLPFTFGVFGSWGSGKSVFLGLLAGMLSGIRQHDKLHNDLHGRYKVIYFNAWKYASFMEVIPALVTRMIETAASDDSNNIPDTKDELISLSRDMLKLFGAPISSLLKKHLGNETVEQIQALIKYISDNPTKSQAEELLKMYHSQVDQTQNSLGKFLTPRLKDKRMVVLIDELDRCDPHEAFEVIKQLRIFFTMRKLPLVFVLSVNPEPVGLAIRHQYGLEEVSNDFESRRILEKFVDSYMDMADSISLEPFILSQFKKREYKDDDLSKLSLVHFVDKPVDPFGNLQGETIFNNIRTSNPYYANLRVLEKSLDSVLAFQIKNDDDLFWARWHLEILKHNNIDVRKKIKLLSDDFGNLATRCNAEFVNILYDDGYIMHNGSILIPDMAGKGLKTGTGFYVFRKFFWEEMNRLIGSIQGRNKTPEDEKKIGALREFLADTYLMSFLASMCALPVKGKYGNKSSLFAEHLSNNDRANEHYKTDDWKKYDFFGEFSKLLYES